MLLRETGVRSGESAPSSAKEGGGRSLHGKSLIVADADSRVRELLTLLLREEGAAVHEADSRTGLFELFAAVESGLLDADLVLCDDAFPGCPTHAVHARLSAMRIPAPGFVIVTARSPSPYANVEGQPVLQKPFRIAQLFSVVHAALRAERSR